MPTETIKVPVELPVTIEWDRTDHAVWIRASDPLGNWYHGGADRTKTGWSVKLWVNSNPIPVAIRTVPLDRELSISNAVISRVVTAWKEALAESIRVQTRRRRPAPTKGRTNG